MLIISKVVQHSGNILSDHTPFNILDEEAGGCLKARRECPQPTKVIFLHPDLVSRDSGGNPSLYDILQF
jgi:hypothetical protein